ncbi:MAG: hypothetical protein HY376_01215 [Candidatus Blackburnbacteria bacterium]|nr:hypothetical protein [Candidatus Blackburnbacteria bacterium]
MTVADKVELFKSRRFQVGADYPDTLEVGGRSVPVRWWTWPTINGEVYVQPRPAVCTNIHPSRTTA